LSIQSHPIYPIIRFIERGSHRQGTQPVILRIVLRLMGGPENTLNPSRWQNMP
jgi:hypothetical protein